MKNLVKTSAVCFLLLILITSSLFGCQPSAESRAASLNNRANDLYDAGKYAEAVAEYNEAIRLDPDTALYYDNRGLAYYYLEEWDLAINDYTQAIDLNPGNAATYYRRGAAYERKQQYLQAINDYETVIRLSEDEAWRQKAGDRITYIGQHHQSEIWAVTDIFPHNPIVDLDFPSLLLYANVNSQPVKAYSDIYDVEWFCNNVLISTEASLTEKPFLEAIGGKEGTYIIAMVVRYKGTDEMVGPAVETTVTAKRDKPVVIIPRHWVSATPGIGLKTWDATGTGVDWWGYDIDLEIQGTTGTLITTFMTASPTVPPELRQGIGTAITTLLDNVKDDGTNIEFSYITGANNQITVTYRLSRTADGHLKGDYHLVDQGGVAFDGDIGGVSTPSEWIGIVDLMPAF